MVNAPQKKTVSEVKGGSVKTSQRVSNRAIRWMSYESRQIRFRQEKDEFVRAHMEYSSAEMDEAIRRIAEKWRV